MLRSKMQVVGLLLAAGLCPAFKTRAASIGGTVVRDGATPVTGAVVYYNNIRNLQRDASGRLVELENPVSGSVTTGTGGVFAIPGVPAGKYTMCAAGPASGDLRSCEWGGPSAIVSISDTQPAAGLTLNIRTGVLIRVSVLDENARIAAGAKLLVGVISDSGHFARAGNTARTGNTFVYTVAVPKREPIRLVLDSDAQLFDPSGQGVLTRQPGLRLSVGDTGDVNVSLTAR